MKKGSKLLLTFSSSLLMTTPIWVVAACSEQNLHLREQTVIKPEIDKTALGFIGQNDTVEGTGYKIDKKWILDNKNKIFDGDTSLFSSTNDISNLRVKPSNVNETNMEISFTLAKGKSIGKNKQPTLQPTNFEILVKGFKTQPRTIQTLTNLLVNNLSSKVQPRSFSTPKEKYITINTEPKFDTRTENVFDEWLKTQGDQYKSLIDLGNSTEPNALWIPYGWSKTGSNSPESDIWNWLENKDVENGDLYSLMNNLLKDYKYFDENKEIKRIYFYWTLTEELVDTTSNPDISVYKWTLSPAGWGLRVNNNGVEDNLLQDNVTIPSDADFIKGSYPQNGSGKWEIRFKKQTGIAESEAQTIDFTPNFIPKTN